MFLIICVPTPDFEAEPDLRYVENTTGRLAACLRPGQLVSLESTPTRTRGIALALLPEVPGWGRFHLVVFPNGKTRATTFR